MRVCAGVGSGGGFGQGNAGIATRGHARAAGNFWTAELVVRGTNGRRVQIGRARLEDVEDSIRRKIEAVKQA